MKLLKATNYKIKCNENLKKKSKSKPKRSFILPNGSLFDLWCLRLVKFIAAPRYDSMDPRRIHSPLTTNPKSSYVTFAARFSKKLEFTTTDG